MKNLTKNDKETILAKGLTFRPLKGGRFRCNQFDLGVLTKNGVKTIQHQAIGITKNKSGTKRKVSENQQTVHIPFAELIESWGRSRIVGCPHCWFNKVISLDSYSLNHNKIITCSRCYKDYSVSFLF